MTFTLAHSPGTISPATTYLGPDYIRRGLPAIYSGNSQDAERLQAALTRFPAKLSTAAARRYSDKFVNEHQAAADSWLADTADWFKKLSGRFDSYDMSDRDICELARRAAFRVREIMASCPQVEVVDVDTGEISRYKGLLPKWLAVISLTELAKWTMPRTWRRRLRREYRQGREMLAYKLADVGHDKDKYCSRQGVEERSQQKARWHSYAENIVLERDGDTLLLADVLKQSVVHRRAEMYVMTLAIQELAEAEKLSWSMFTLTVPPEYHTNPKSGRNSWNGRSPREAHDLLNERWQLIRASLADQGIKLIGLRVVEPHKDGTPHWHVGLYYHEDDQDAIVSTIRRYFPGEAAAKETVGDPERGSFATYMMKYITKTLQTDSYAAERYDVAAAVDAWRGTWGIRAFQFFGVPGISLWRELRRQEEAPAGEGDLTTKLWRAARGTRPALFIQLLGGLAASTRPARLINPENETVRGGIDITVIADDAGAFWSIPAPAEDAGPVSGQCCLIVPPGARQFYVENCKTREVIPLKTRKIWTLTVIQSCPSKATLEEQYTPKNKGNLPGLAEWIEAKFESMPSDTDSPLKELHRLQANPKYRRLA